MPKPKGAPARRGGKRPVTGEGESRGECQEVQLAVDVQEQAGLQNMNDGGSQAQGQ
jgi:hypothetical protein